MTKDYYKILGISEFSTQDEIKKAYRNLVRKFHPDVAGNSDEIVSRFKDINEAYEFLSDSFKKSDYDKARKFYNYAESKKEYNNQYKNTKNTTNPNYKKTKTEEKKSENKQTEEKQNSFSFNWEEFIKNFKTETETKRTQTPQKGKDINTDVEISVLESINGTTKTINMLKTQVCPKCGGRKFVNGSACKHCHGKGDISEYKKFNVRIPAGIKDKSKIRLAGEGEKGQNGGKNGDLYLTIHIAGVNEFSTEGNNVLKTVPISPFEAVLGAAINIDTPIGKVSLKIAKGTRSGQKIRLAGCGLENNGLYGDMIVTIEIQIPKQISPDELNLYKKLQEISINSVR